jgi:hypothetical protein
MGHSVALVGLLLTLCGCQSSAFLQASNSRKESWQRGLDEWKFSFKDPDVHEVLSKYHGESQIQLIDKPEGRWYARTVRIARNGKQLLELSSDKGAVFQIHKNVLFFPLYEGSSCGCTVVAYDLDTGKQLWKTELRAVGQVGHSVYSNSVRLEISRNGEDEVLLVTGQEAYGDYREILDIKTGEMLAHKIYRQGFGG